MKNNGIDGCGSRPVSAKMPKRTVSITENTAAGMFSSWVWAIELSGEVLMFVGLEEVVCAYVKPRLAMTVGW
jgi:hypothetical protein